MSALPGFGERVVTADGVVCHICGEAFHALGSHVFHGHGKLMDGYRKEFGLSQRGLVSEELRERMRQRALDMKLSDLGKETRVTHQGRSPSMSPEGRRIGTSQLIPGRGLLAAHESRRTKTHCKHGHEFSIENTRINPDGSRKCRKCDSIRRAGARRRTQ